MLLNSSRFYGKPLFIIKDFIKNIFRRLNLIKILKIQTNLFLIKNVFDYYCSQLKSGCIKRGTEY